MSYGFIQGYYGLQFTPGLRVQHTVTKECGKVGREDRSQMHYVMVRFDGRKHASPCHPRELVFLPTQEPQQ
jgi:hypothetical protein